VLYLYDFNSWIYFHRQRIEAIQADCSFIAVLFTSETFLEVLFRSRVPLESEQRLNSRFHHRLRSLKRWLQSVWNQDGNEAEHEYLSNLSSITEFINNFQMFITKTGILGIVATDCQIQASDELYILADGFTLFILRKDSRYCHDPASRSHVTCLSER
jgi:hypothetical protein